MIVFFSFNQNIISVKQFRSISVGPNLLFKTVFKMIKNLIGIQSVKHILDQNFLLKKKSCFDKFTKIYGECSKNLNTKIMAENIF